MKPLDSEDGISQDRAALEALGLYGLECESLRSVQSGGPKALWKASAGGRSYALKRFRHPPEKVAFFTAAQRYARDRGAQVPALLKSRSGADYVVVDGQAFAVFEFIEGKPVSWANPAEFRSSVESLADFHARSRGFSPPPGCLVSSKLGRWPEQYRSIIERLKEWSAVAQGLSDPFCRLFLKNSGWAVQLAEFACRLLDRFGYPALVREFGKHPGLCHQDYGEGNCINRGGSIFILDLDGVTFDLPGRDIRKIMVKTAADLGPWSQRAADQIASWFNSVNPMSPREWAVAYTDILFPHTFHDVAKNRFLKGKPTSSAKLAEAVNLDLSKAAALRGVFLERFGCAITDWPALP